jgi:hypothetical protein
MSIVLGTGTYSKEHLRPILLAGKLAREHEHFEHDGDQRHNGASTVFAPIQLSRKWILEDQPYVRMDSRYE